MRAPPEMDVIGRKRLDDPCPGGWSTRPQVTTARHLGAASSEPVNRPSLPGTQIAGEILLTQLSVNFEELAHRSDPGAVSRRCECGTEPMACRAREVLGTAGGPDH